MWFDTSGVMTISTPSLNYFRGWFGCNEHQKQ